MRLGTETKKQRKSEIGREKLRRIETLWKIKRKKLQS